MEAELGSEKFSPENHPVRNLDRLIVVSGVWDLPRGRSLQLKW